MDIVKLLQTRRALVDKALDKVLPKENEPPVKLHRAMRYSVFSGGKRIRPILAIESCLACGGNISDAMDVACAIELVHTFSLIHDDLPAMDNDDYRRGKLTCHKKFDEATAILAGDNLLPLAFKILAKEQRPKIGIELIKELVGAVGSRGLIGGQCVDIEYEGNKKTSKVLDYINIHKTAALIAAALKMGAIAADAGQKDAEAIEKFGLLIGEAFQIVDDILDEGDTLRVIGKDAAARKAARLTKRSKEALRPFGARARNLTAIADYLAGRKI